MRDPVNFPALLESFFTVRLLTQRKVSAHTIASYRDTFRLLLQFAQKRLRKLPSRLAFGDLDPSLIAAFLDDLENTRHNGPKSRNLRLTAIRSFFRYAALEAPADSGTIQRVLAIPNQRQPRALVGFLTRPEIEALLAAPDRTQWLGRRDHAFLMTAVQTGLRLSEMTGLLHEDVWLRAGAHVRCRGKECHSYCISSRRRNETTIIHPYQQACDLAFSSADVLPAVRTGIGLGPYTVANGAAHVGPMSEPYPA
jgi:integrase/recombinase XerD